MNEKDNKIGGGLLPLPKDKRDFDLKKFFGMIPLEEVPEDDFVVSEPLGIKDQLGSDFCVAAATCSVSEDQEGVLLSMEWFFSQIKKRMGEYNSWGADLRTACKVAVKKGFLEEKLSPYRIQDHTRDFIADWRHWEENRKFEFEWSARTHRKKSYFRVL